MFPGKLLSIPETKDEEQETHTHARERIADLLNVIVVCDHLIRRVTLHAKAEHLHFVLCLISTVLRRPLYYPMEYSPPTPPHAHPPQAPLLVDLSLCLPQLPRSPPRPIGPHYRSVHNI